MEQLSENLNRLKQSDIIRNFIIFNKAAWDHSKWLELCSFIENNGFAPIDYDQVGLFLEEEKIKYLSNTAKETPQIEDVDERIRGVIASTLKIPVSEAVNSAKLVENLGADSLALVELLASLEKEFVINIPSTDAKSLTLVIDVINYVRKKYSSIG